MNLAHWLERSSRVHAGRPAIAEGTRVWSSYAELADRAARAASWLRVRGVGVGDRVALFMGNRPDYLVMMWGAWWADPCWLLTLAAGWCGASSTRRASAPARPQGADCRVNL